MAVPLLRRRGPRRSVRLTRRGVGFLSVGVVSLLAAYALATPELLLPAVLTILLPLLAALLVRARRIDLEVSRTFDPPVVAAGEQAVVELLVATASETPTPALAWRDASFWRAGAASGVVRPLTGRRGRLLNQGNVARMRYGITPPRRGIVAVGPLSVVLEDPFGLAIGEIPVGRTDRLVVSPALVALPDTGLAILLSEGTSMLATRAVGGEDDLSTREYRRGDALRRVHWRASARHGELMVRQEEPRSHAEARIVLDTRLSGYFDADIVVGARPGDPGAGGPSGATPDEEESASFELAVSLAASIAVHLSRAGFEVEFVETGHPQLAPVSPTPPFVETLATLRLSAWTGEYSSDSPLGAAVGTDGAGGSVFAVLADADEATLDRLAAQRISFTLAVAFIIASRPSASVERLRLAGWTCVTMHPDDTVDAAWRAVADVHGAGRVG